LLRKAFEPKRDEVTDRCGRLHNLKLHDLYSSLNIISVIKSLTMRGTGDAAIRRRGEIGVGKHEGKRAFGRCRHRWEDKIKMGLEKWDVGMYWIYLALYRDKCWSVTEVMTVLLHRMR